MIKKKSKVLNLPKQITSSHNETSNVLYLKTMISMLHCLVGCDCFDIFLSNLLVFLRNKYIYRILLFHIFQGQLLQKDRFLERCNGTPQ